MSALTTAPRSAPSPDREAAPAAPTALEFHYAQTDSFVALLQQLRASLLVTTYQANKLLVVRAVAGGLSTLVRHFDKPMGLAIDSRRLALGTLNQIWFLRNAPDIAPRVEPAGVHDACYLPRSCHVTGDIAVHEMAWASPPLSPGGRGDAGEGELWIVNTRFSCLCTLDPDYSFVPRWRPPFISALAAEDRCHLNGLAIVDGQPKYVTALGDTVLRKTCMSLGPPLGPSCTGFVPSVQPPPTIILPSAVRNSGQSPSSFLSSRQGTSGTDAAGLWPGAEPGASTVRRQTTAGRSKAKSRGTVSIARTRGWPGAWCMDRESGTVSFHGPVMPLARVVSRP